MNVKQNSILRQHKIMNFTRVQFATRVCKSVLISLLLFPHIFVLTHSKPNNIIAIEF